MIDMGITDYIKTRLLNNRVEQYNTKSNLSDFHIVTIFHWTIRKINYFFINYNSF